MPPYTKSFETIRGGDETGLRINKTFDSKEAAQEFIETTEAKLRVNLPANAFIIFDSITHKVVSSTNSGIGMFSKHQIENGEIDVTNQDYVYYETREAGSFIKRKVDKLDDTNKR